MSHSVDRSISPAVSTLIGVIIVLCASALDAIGMNLQRSDHLRNASRPPHLQRSALVRPVFLLGMFLYLGSQIAGSGCGLIFLHPTAVAPLGAATLVFNVIFAWVFLRQVITLRHQIGTLTIILGAVLIAYFGYLDDADIPVNPRRTDFIAIFATEDFLVLATFAVLRYASYHDFQRPRWLLAATLNTAEEKRKRFTGAAYAFLGGIIASQTIICAKTGVDALVMILKGVPRPHAADENVVIGMLLVTGVFQVYCLTYALKLTTPVIVVPIFFAMYTTLAFLNGALFKNTWRLYQLHQYILFFVGVVILINGVYLITQDRDSTIHDLVDADEERGGPPKGEARADAPGLAHDRVRARKRSRSLDDLPVPSLLAGTGGRGDTVVTEPVGSTAAARAPYTDVSGGLLLPLVLALPGRLRSGSRRAPSLSPTSGPTHRGDPGGPRGVLASTQSLPPPAGNSLVSDSSLTALLN